MSRAVITLRRLAFGLAVTASLSAGASAALASPRAESQCTDPRAACVVSASCISYCFPRGGVCSNGCCACLR